MMGAGLIQAGSGPTNILISRVSCVLGRDMSTEASAKTSFRPLIALVLLCLIAWLPGFFTLPPLDRDESRFAQASKQMLETGDFVDINLGAGPRYEKPAGIYWLQAASTAVLGEGLRNRI